MKDEINDTVEKKNLLGSSFSGASSPLRLPIGECVCVCVWEGGGRGGRGEGVFEGGGGDSRWQ